MLNRLEIRDFALARSLDLEFAPGLNLITGETGSGKSILVDALGFALGDRANADLIRAGADNLRVTAIFRPEEAWAKRRRAWFDEKGLPWEDGDLHLRRELSKTGRGRAWINGESVPVAVLGELGQALVDFHGQHEHQSLTRAHEQADLLDRFGELEQVKADVRACWSDWDQKRLALEGPGLSPAERVQREEFLEYQIRELENANLKVGEWAGLKSNAALQSSLGKRGALLERLAESLETESGAIEKGDAALADLRRLALLDPQAGAWVEKTEESLRALSELGRFLRDYREGLDLDPIALERNQTRLADLETLGRKHGTDEAGLIEALLRFRGELQALRFAQEDMAGLRAAMEQAAKIFSGKADALCLAREKAAARLIKLLIPEIHELLSVKAVFSVSVRLREDAHGPFELRGKRCAGGPQGCDSVEFLFAPNPGEGVKPLAKIASGGELSRLTLALKAVLLSKEGASAMVFDEIDAGISGRVAQVVGSRISALALRAQILCITHLPQIASRPGLHLKVSKQVEGGKTETHVTALDGEAREREVASLMDGVELSVTGLDHARELLRAAADKP